MIGKARIQLVLWYNGDGRADGAYYVYRKYNNPIILSVCDEDSVLKMSDSVRGAPASEQFLFPRFSPDSAAISGSWIDLRTKKSTVVRLTRDFQIVCGDSVCDNSELLLPVSVDKWYFRMSVAKDAEDFYPRTNALCVYDKKADTLFQELTFTDVGDLSRFSDLCEIADYNRDGHPDLSVFGMLSASGDATREYFLFDTAAGCFSEESFSGVNLVFGDSQITSSGHCCGGRIWGSSIYRLVGNVLVPVAEVETELGDEGETVRETRRCYQWDAVRKENNEVECDQH